MSVGILERELLTRNEAALILGIQPQTLTVWHSTGRYALPVVKVGRSVRYRRSDLEKWLAERTVTNSGEAESL
jgi:excisionase family DNA binding protein